MLQAEGTRTAYRLLLAVHGSRGDIYPMLSIGQEMRRRGHEVLFAVPERFRHIVETAGLQFRLLRSDTEPQEYKHLSEDERRKRVSSKVALRDVMYPTVEATYRDLLEHGRDTDMILFPFFLFPGSMAAEKLGIPYANIFFSPGQLNSMHDPPLLPPIQWMHPLQRRSLTLASGINKLGGWAIRSWSKPYRDLRKREGFPPQTGDPILDPPRSPWLTLALFSSCMGVAQPDWPKHTVTTGFPFFEENLELESQAIQDFLNAGDPPLVAALGSSTSTHRMRFFTATIQAAKNLGRRALLIAGEAAEELRQSVDRDQVFVTEYAPYSSVFPKAACIVLAGSVGPISHALRAGRPMLIVASEHAADQPDAGARCERIGVAKWLHLPQYTAERAEKNLRALLSDQRFVCNAGKCGEMMRAENGADTAADVLEKVLREHAGSPQR